MRAGDGLGGIQVRIQGNGLGGIQVSVQGEWHWIHTVMFRDGCSCGTEEYAALGFGASAAGFKLFYFCF